MKILVSDFDESFYNDDFDKNIRLVNNFVRKGNIFIIATGRNMHDLMKTIKDKNILVSYYICSDGSTIYDQFLNIIYRKDLESKDARTLYNMLANDKNIISPYIDTTTGLTGDVNRSANRVVGCFINYNKALDLALEINNTFDDAYAYLSKTHININNKHVNKATSLSYLKEYYNFDEFDIYTFGNDINDISLSMYDNNYILKSASDELKKDFECVVESFEEVITDIEQV